MYTKEDISKGSTKFWTSFGQYMKPVPNLGENAVSWLNYKTGIRFLFFKMTADLQKASIAIELRHPTRVIRMRHYHKLEAIKNLMEESTGYQWSWQPFAEDNNGQTYSSVSQIFDNVSIMNEADWPAIIGFLKPRIIALDSFWETVKDGF